MVDAESHSNGGRVGFVDVAKGLCIILVVMMHATLGVGEAMGGEGYLHSVVAFARPFRMPDFFFVSGLFLSRVIDRDWRLYADRRVLHFAYFYLLWLLIQSLFKFGQVSGGSAAGFLHHLAIALVEPFSTLWFIYLLAVLSVVTRVVRRLPPALLIVAAALLEIAPIDTGFLVVDEFCARWVFFLAGWLMAPHAFALAAWARRGRGAATLGLAIWAAINGAMALAPSGLAGFATLASLPVASLMLGVAGALAVVTMAALIETSRLGAVLRYCGRHSIAIYLAFVLPMAATRTALVRLGLPLDIGTVAAIVTAVAVMVPLLAERLLRDTPARFLFERPAALRLAASSRLRLQPAE